MRCSMTDSLAHSPHVRRATPYSTGSRRLQAARSAFACAPQRIPLGLAASDFSSSAALRRQRAPCSVKRRLELGVGGAQRLLGSTCRWRPQFTSANSRSPSSSATSRVPGLAGGATASAASTSWSSSSTLARTSGGLRPVEPDARGALAELRGARQCRQRPRDPAECPRGSTAAPRRRAPRPSALPSTRTRSSAASAAPAKMCGWRRTQLVVDARGRRRRNRTSRAPRPCARGTPPGTAGRRVRRAGAPRSSRSIASATS